MKSILIGLLLTLSASCFSNELTANQILSMSQDEILSLGEIYECGYNYSDNSGALMPITVRGQSLKAVVDASHKMRRGGRFGRVTQVIRKCEPIY